MLEWSSNKCPGDEVENSTTMNGTLTNFTISDLRGDTNYNVTITASNAADNSTSDIFTVETSAVGKVSIVVLHHRTSVGQGSRPYFYMTWARMPRINNTIDSRFIILPRGLQFSAFHSYSSSSSSSSSIIVECDWCDCLYYNCSVGDVTMLC